MIKAAFGNVDYTPTKTERFGQINPRWERIEKTHSPLLARVAMFDDGKTRGGLMELDQNVMTQPMADALRAALGSATGSAAENWMVACTHTHSCGATFPWLVEADDFSRVDALCAKVATLAREMAARLTPCELRYGTIEAPGWSFNRRPVYRIEGREQVGTHGMREGENFLRTEGEDESHLGMLQARDAHGASLGGIVNFACHPTCMYGEPAWSSDYPGALLEHLRQKLGGDFVFANGPCGDLGNTSAIPGRAPETGPAHVEKMGAGLAAKAIESLESAENVRGNTIRIDRVMLEIPQRRITGKQAELARKYIEARTRGEDVPYPIREIYGYERHFHIAHKNISLWLANEILGMWEWQRRVGTRELVEAVEVQCIIIGDVAMVSMPVELFSKFGHEIRARSPFKKTIIVELANAWMGYVPTEEAFEHGGYETSVGIQSRLIPAAGRMITDAAIDLLEKNFSPQMNTDSHR